MTADRATLMDEARRQAESLDYIASNAVGLSEVQRQSVGAGAKYIRALLSPPAPTAGLRDRAEKLVDALCEVAQTCFLMLDDSDERDDGVSVPLKLYENAADALERLEALVPDTNLGYGAVGKALRALLASAPVGAEGWVLVPKEPTRDMLNASVVQPMQVQGSNTETVRYHLYKAMLAASPAPSPATPPAEAREDIVTRLRQEADASEELPNRIGDSDIPTMREAADVIASQRATIERLERERDEAKAISQGWELQAGEAEAEARDLVERYARAICTARGHDPETLHQVVDPTDYADTSDSRGYRFIYGWRKWVAAAEAVLALPAAPEVRG